MKLAKTWPQLCLILTCVLLFELQVAAQQTATTTPGSASTKTSSSSESNEKAVKSVRNENLEPKQNSESAVSAQNNQKTMAQTAPSDQSSDEASAILPVYSNYLEKYLLGPEDVISVEVFGQPNYSKTNITVPPTAKISYPLITKGVFVGGKTTEQVAEEIKKRLDEYIIDPQVTVTLDKVGSAHYSVLGRVNAPGVKVMNRRYNVYEAVAEAGGFAKESDKKRVILMRLSPQGSFTQTTIDFDKLTKGKLEVPYLAPGDQIIVPEKKWSTAKILNIINTASAVRFIFGSPF